MSVIEDITTTVEEQVLDAIRTGQGATLTAVRTVSDAVAGLVPNLPAPAFYGMLPAPEQALKSAFDFAEQLLALQREFAEDLVATVAPKASTTDEV
jgi:hypothetical protein